MRTNLRRLLPAVLLGGVAMLAGGAATAQDTVFLSTQLRPVEEATKMRQIILRDAPGRVTYVVDEPAPMTTRMQAELRGGTRTVSVVGAAHGELLKITPYLDRYPSRLSGGQRQRVAVARALAVEPAVLLMDEPLSNLDALLRLEMRAELKAVLREAGTTTIYVTHDQTEAMGLADRIAVMEKGRIVQMDRPGTLYRHPRTRFVGGFVGTPPMNFIPVVVAGGRVALGGMIVPAPVRDGPVLMGIRAEDLDLTDDTAEAVALMVRVTEPMGSHLLVTGETAGVTVRAMAPAEADLPAGRPIGFRPRADRVVWMDPESGQALEMRA